MAAPISASLRPVAEISRRAALMSMPYCDARPHQRQSASVFAARELGAHDAVLLAGAVAGNVAGAAVGWGVAAVVAVALYRAQR